MNELLSGKFRGWHITDVTIIGKEFLFRSRRYSKVIVTEPLANYSPIISSDKDNLNISIYLRRAFEDKPDDIVKIEEEERIAVDLYSIYHIQYLLQRFSKDISLILF